MMLIHKICMAFRGLGNLRNVDIVINEIAAMLLHMGKKFYNIEMISTECSCTDVFFNLFFFSKPRKIHSDMQLCFQGQ